ncbi:T-cell receptor beta chain V region CTL-L17 [Cricetulus griseus]|nr:T-cell receptor beta chain V region CTL-L17 [Cricetulus griseus]ERE90177.1 Immunoglobulin V-set, subgroup containing protein [Cricetulus griseus]
MDSRLFCCVVLCLLGPDQTKAGVSQSPIHRITKIGQNVSFWCNPISSHNSLYWYRQRWGQGPEFLAYFQNKVAPDKSGLPRNHFIERPEGSYSFLKIQPVKQEDSAVYLCASSSATAEHSRFLPAHKPQMHSPLHSCPKP